MITEKENTGKDNKDVLWNANYNKVMTANFTLFFAFYLLTPLLPLYLSETFHATKDLIGIVLSGYTVTALLFRPFSGYVVDSFPRKKVLMVCFFLFFLLFGGYLAAGSFVFFALVRTLHGGPFGALTVANSTVAIDVLPSSRRTEGIGYYGLSNNLAMAIAPSIGVFIYKYTHNFDILFWMAFIIAGLGMLVDSTVKVPQREIIREKKKLSLDRFFLVRGWLLGANIVMFSFCYGVLSNYLAIYSKEILGITGGTGTYFMLLATGLVVSRIQGSKALRNGKLTQNATQGIFLSCIGYILFVAVPTEVGYYLSALLIGLGNGHLFPAMQNMFINIAGNNERGTANSTLLTSWDFGIGVGVVFGGVIAEHFGYTAAFATVAALHVIGVLLFVFCSRDFYLRNKRR
ncbi:MAG: MFS transporter [Prevotella sp.]|nr:MFS transporter [Prevotella sp.]